MKRPMFVFASLMIIATLVLTACGATPTAAPATAAPATAAPATVAPATAAPATAARLPPHDLVRPPEDAVIRNCCTGSYPSDVDSMGLLPCR